MSRKPTSESDQEAALEFLERCGWNNAELIWEQIQEAALDAWISGEQGEAAELWHGALEVAEEHFADNDPRRVTSRVNAFAGEAQRDWDDAFIDEQISHWESSAEWVSNLKPSIPARSSTFHLRLRVKHQGAYDETRLGLLRELHSEGLSRLRGSPSERDAADRQVRWKAEKPEGFNDYRKLLAAVLFMRYPQ